MNQKNAGQDPKERDGIHLGRFHAVTVALIAALALILLISSYHMGKSYTRMTEAVEDNFTAQQAAANMQAASDFLTAEARTFIATGETEHVEKFFEEMNVTRRRERAVEDISSILDSPPSYAYLSAAMDSSNELLEIE